MTTSNQRASDAGSRSVTIATFIAGLCKRTDRAIPLTIRMYRVGPKAIVRIPRVTRTLGVPDFCGSRRSVLPPLLLISRHARNGRAESSPLPSQRFIRIRPKTPRFMTFFHHLVAAPTQQLLTGAAIYCFQVAVLVDDEDG